MRKMRFGNQDGSGIRVGQVTYEKNDKRANYVSHFIAHEKRKEHPHRGWRRTRMEDRPITCRGVIAEAMKHGEQDATLLQSDTKMEKLLGQREAIENGDIAKIAKETGIELTHTQLVAVLKRIMAMAAAVPVLQNRGSQQLQLRLDKALGMAILVRHWHKM